MKRLSTIEFSRRRHPQHGDSMYDAFVINGHLLLDDIHRAGNPSIECVEPFGWTTQEFQKEYADRLLLLGPATLQSGRREILLCPLCADFGCGCVSAEISLDGDTLVWHDLGYEGNPESKSLQLFHMSDIRFSFAEFQHLLRTII